MIKSEKQAIIERLQERFQDSAAAICVEFRGVNVEKVTRFRRELQQSAGEYQVVKNTLAKRAIRATRFQALDPLLSGPTGIVFCPTDVAAAAKVVTKFVEDTNGAFAIKGGVVDGALFDAKGIQQVATLPPRQELLARLVAGLQSPISGLVGALQGVIREYVFTLQAVADQRANAAPSE
ncbi:50S ribosomal protein L10 [Candidatus Vecturithrix granuli]|uniref:Large ribosomal subunit protein uL10 n=1 Tax=Vecturithrix granuli TaxID=1499967 RepID=A0A081C338_VECG1|nr:50S ribosomal protein L10 [Candidatus Vecturithrix granuli]